MDHYRHEHVLRPLAGSASRRARQFAAAIGVLLVSPTGDVAGQPAGGLFGTPAGAVAGVEPTPSALPIVRRRLVSIDLALITPHADAASPSNAVGMPFVSARSLELNLFDDAVFTGLLERTAPTFSGGQVLAGRLVGVEGGTLTLVVNGAVVAGTVRTPEATYRIRSVGNGLHAISQIDPAWLPVLREPIPRRRFGPVAPGARVR